MAKHKGQARFSVYQHLYEGVPHLDGAAAVLLAAGVVQQVPLRGPEV